MMEGLGWGWMAWFVEGECIIASFGWIFAFEAFAWALLACQVGLVRVDKDIDKVEWKRKSVLLLLIPGMSSYQMAWVLDVGLISRCL